MNTKYILSTLMLLSIIAPVLAQGAPPATPIDGGLSLLLAAGGAYGVKKLMNKKK
ncbi:MAG: hypothetical protein ACI9A7_000211 [Cyclobacteriaceae bacterium]|jgi:hypothetical protein